MEEKNMPNDNIIYAQVLLLDNKIESWKICQDQKQSPYEFKAYWKQDRIQDYTMETFVFNVEETCIKEGWIFNWYVYSVLAPKWVNQWEYADDYKGSKAKESTLEEVTEDRKRIENAFNGRFKIIRKLGAD